MKKIKNIWKIQEKLYSKIVFFKNHIKNFKTREKHRNT